MTFTILLALSGFILSAVAIYYSVLGLTAIFAAAFWPIVVMGTTLEISKLVAASWLKAKWSRIPFFMKTYMMISVLILMLITSMGIFGFLSKAHSDQTLVSGDVQSKISVIDEKIKTERENIEAARKALAQMDAAVDQTIARSTTEQGAGRAAQLRRQQQAERTRLQKDISTAQTNISKLNDEAAPIRAEVRKVEAEVGPIKYIAKLIYGDSADNNLLEKAVTWVIITIIFVFDPLAILMILASQMSYQWWREEKQKTEPPVEIKTEEKPIEPKEKIEPIIPEIIEEPLPEAKKEDPVEQWNEMLEAAEKAVLEEQDVDIDSLDEVSPSEKLAMKRWKEEIPGANIHRQRKLLEKGLIRELPWLKYVEEDLKARPDNVESESKKKTYIIKDQSNQVVKTKKI